MGALIVTRSPFRRTSTPVTVSPSDRIFFTGVDNHTSPPCDSIAAASERHSPMEPSGWKPNLLNALLRVKYVRNTLAGRSSDPTAKNDALMLRKMPCTPSFLVHFDTHSAVEISSSGKPEPLRAAPIPLTSLAPCRVSFDSRKPHPPPVTSMSFPPMR